MKVKMIVAMDDQRFIGKNGELPWRLSADMSRFRNLTIADGFNAVIMGRKTWDSLPEKYRRYCTVRLGNASHPARHHQMGSP